MILRSARWISPDGIRDGREVMVEEGKIAEIRPPAPRLRRTGEQTRTSSKDVVDLDGNYLAPGFIDLHVHGALGRDNMEASVEAFQAICDYHASGGTTSLLLTTATAPMDNIIDELTADRLCSASHNAFMGGAFFGSVPFIANSRRARFGIAPESSPRALR